MSIPPSFQEARNLRQKARAASLSPDHWYAVEYEEAVKPGQVVEVRFGGDSIALFRGTDGVLRALENRCAHRQIKLSLGHVGQCRLTCAYHGWTYDGQGRVVEIPHDLFGRPMPSFQIGSYPVKARYGLIWLFPGDPALAEQRKLPEIPELEGKNPWAYVPLSFLWTGHHSMVMDNLCDLTHAHLHRRFPSFLPGRLLSCEQQEDCVLLRYEAKVGPFAHRRSAKVTPLEICYDYPYHWARFEWSNIAGRIKYWTFLLPVDDRTTRVFFVFCYDRLKLPYVPFRLGHSLIRLALRLSNPMVRALLDQDGFALKAEQEGYEGGFDAAPLELNPVVQHLHKLTIRKWEEHLARQAPGNARATT